MENKSELVFMPAPGMGHIVSVVEFAKRLHDQDQRFSITFLLIKPFHPPFYILYVESLAASDTRFRYVHLPPSPPLPLPPPPEQIVLTSPEKNFSNFLESYKPHVRDAIVNHVLSSSPATTRLAGLVVDFFNTPMIDIANEFATPTYLIFPSDAAFLGLILHLPICHSLIGTEFTVSDPNSVTHFPSYANPVPTSVLPAFLFNKHGSYTCFLNHARRLDEIAASLHRRTVARPRRRCPIGERSKRDREMARRTTSIVGGVSLLLKPRVLRSAAAGRDCDSTREECPPVLVVHTTAAATRRVRDADRLWR
ncbi:UDP-glucose flavonoid 3-O-glucosyltransferase 6 [Camellia lanceoleosa]|uniref:UDP-glucose flavonoid 3-O-glucosyltransferase 6 n=1 Tax=Camellia lanceoleosa TaxID=1840588 RepID=A0ACC0IDF0_9ERIC|nr:UDP-glucose flavonoid 3-O-glucosyltransferase 6 [Camellia lanceoleosa]